MDTKKKKRRGYINTGERKDYRNLEILNSIREKKKKEKKILRIFDRNLIESCHTISFRSWIILRVTMRMIPLRIIVANFQDVEMQLYYPPLPRSVVHSIVIVQVHARALSTFHVTSFETRGSRLIERETIIDSCTERTRSDTFV